MRPTSIIVKRYALSVQAIDHRSRTSRQNDFSSHTNHYLDCIESPLGFARLPIRTKLLRFEGYVSRPSKTPDNRLICTALPAIFITLKYVWHTLAYAHTHTFTCSRSFSLFLALSLSLAPFLVLPFSLSFAPSPSSTSRNEFEGVIFFLARKHALRHSNSHNTRFSHSHTSTQKQETRSFLSFPQPLRISVNYLIGVCSR